MLTDTVRNPTDAIKFVARGVALSLGLFGVLRLPWSEAHVVLPLTLLQGALAAHLMGAPTRPMETTLACSGADALALCVAAILAYPVRWRARLVGAAGGATLILVLNTLRIGTLGRVVAFPAWFDALHVYVWPAALTLTIGAYVLAWMHFADRALRSDVPGPPSSRIPQPTLRFVLLAGVFFIAFVAASPLYLESPLVLTLAGLVARAGALILSLTGMSAYAVGNVLWTPRAGFLVTQECIATPLIPIYLAAVCAYSGTWPRMSLGVLAALPTFMALGVIRLLVVALPDGVSPLFLVHAFYQLLVGVVVVAIAAWWRHGRRSAPSYALLGVMAGTLFVVLLGPWFTHAITYPIESPLDDPQGAIAFLPAFQAGLYLALGAAAFTADTWTRFVAGFAILGFSQTAGLVALHVLHTHLGVTAHVRDVRGWAVAGPVVVFAAVVHGAQPQR